MASTRNPQRDSKASEPLLERIPVAPEGMNPIAAKLWKKKAQDLKEAGRLTSGILETLATFCNLVSDMQKAREMMDAAWGKDIFYRYQKAYNDSAKIQLSYARELGFVPSKAATATPKGKGGILAGLDDELDRL
jgi:phage terminase small subunit